MALLVQVVLANPSAQNSDAVARKLDELTSTTMQICKKNFEDASPLFDGEDWSEIDDKVKTAISLIEKQVS